MKSLTLTFRDLYSQTMITLSEKFIKAFIPTKDEWGQNMTIIIDNDDHEYCTHLSLSSLKLS